MKIDLGNSNGLEIDSLWGEFANPAIEKKFRHHNLALAQSRLCIALTVCSFFFVGFAWTDLTTLGYTGPTVILFFVRLLVAIAAGVAIWLIYRRPFSIAIPRIAATAVEIIGMGSFMVVAIYRPGDMLWHGMSMTLMLIVLYTFIPNRLIFSLGVALASTAIFIFITVKIGNLGLSDALTMSVLLLLTNAFGVTANHRYQWVWRNEFRTWFILKRESALDHLTGCYNRRHLHDHLLQPEIARAQYNGLWLTVILCDLDNFKLVNDTYGHQIGDAVLCSFAWLLQKMTRQRVDCVVRYGGEEFFVVLPETDLARGTYIAERLRRATAKNATRHANQTITTTASFGVAAVDFSKAGKNLTQYDLIAAADDLLYRAKNAGRNCVISDEL